MSDNNIFAELKRRNVYKVAVAYGVVAWLLVQAASIILPAFEAPAWTMKVLLVALTLGFPVAVILAWAFEITPEGIKRAEDVEPSESLTKRTGRKLVGITTVLAVIAASLLAFQLVHGRSPARSTASDATKDSGAHDSATVAIPEKSIAVMPFESLSEDKANAYFADGIQDEILTRLAGIADLKVISRTSTEKYKSKPEDLKTVSQQLGVAKVLEGSVQRASDKMRINVQLIDARADTHLWAKSYDRDVKDIFAVESEVSQEVADALQARLSPAEADKVAAAPTNNAAAYDLFLKAEFEEREAESSLKPADFDQAANWYREAIELDPNFALAVARLVNNRMQRHWFVEPMSDRELEEVKQTAQHALELAPTLPEAYVSLGIVYYFGHRQYDEALTEFRRAIELRPNDSNAIQYSSYVHRRLGQFRECLSGLIRSEKQNPRDPSLAGNFGTTYSQLRMWKESERYGGRALSLNPHTVDGMRSLLVSTINGKGDIAGARHLLETFPPDISLIPDGTHATLEGLVGFRAFVCVLERNLPAALQSVNSETASTTSERVRLSARSVIHVLAGDAAGARDEMEEARRLAENRLQERPLDLDATIQLSWIYLALDRKTDALKSAQKAADLLPPERDALVGTYTLYNLAQIKARTGDADGAIEILRRLIAMPAGHEVSIVGLKLNPMWDPIRNNPGFQQLLSGPEQIGPNK